MNVSIHKLTDLWRTWTRVLEDVAWQSRRAEDLTEEAYQELHGELLVELNVQIQRCKSIEHSLPKEMWRLAAPWISLDSLFAADRHMQTVLLGQAKRLQRRWLRRTGHQRRLVLIAIPLVLLLVLIAGFAVTVVIGMVDGGDVSRSIAAWQYWAYRLQRAVTHASLVSKIGALALIILVMGAVFLRSMRQD
jgi:hypothetical protein